MSKNVGTLRELNVKPGDVVECVERESESMSVVSVEVLPEGSPFPGQVRLCLSDYGVGIYNDELFRIISRASDDTPKPWRDMTDDEKGALLLAHHEGKVIEYWTPSNGWRSASFPPWFNEVAYRVKPEPVRETVTLYCDGGNDGRDPMPIGTIVLEDGKPDRDSIKMEEL